MGERPAAWSILFCITGKGSSEFFRRADAVLIAGFGRLREYKKADCRGSVNGTALKNPTRGRNETATAKM